MAAIKITGNLQISPDAQHLIDNHKHLAPDGIEKGLENIGKAGYKAVKETIVSKGLVGKGNLLKSINYEFKKTAKLQKTIIGSTSFKAHMLEDGTKSHLLPYKGRKSGKATYLKKALYWSGLSHPVSVVKHPGVRAYNFMGGTINKMESTGKIEDLFSQGVQEAIEDLLKRGF